MKALYIEPTDVTPELKFEPDSGVFHIIGNSLPEKSVEFYEPIIDWANHFFYSSDVPESVTIDFKLHYYNTPSSKQIARLLKIIETSPFSENITINWFYDEEDFDMLEAGQRYSNMLKIDFKFPIN